jgi:hypothetical protein
MKRPAQRWCGALNVPGSNVKKKTEQPSLLRIT